MIDPILLIVFAMVGLFVGGAMVGAYSSEKESSLVGIMVGFVLAIIGSGALVLLFKAIERMPTP